MKKLIWVCLLMLVCGFACCTRRSSDRPARLAVTNTYLECVVREFLGRDEPVFRLAGPGMCPGHFDVRPSQVERLRDCRLLVRFDFQKSLERKLAPLSGEGLAIAEVRPTGGLCVCGTYEDACRQVSAALVRTGFVSSSEAKRRLEAVSERMNRLADRARGRIAQAGLDGEGVLASGHQRDFCEWLGLRVVGTFRGADVAGTGELQEAIRAGGKASVGHVVANRPEGRRVADALAGRLGARVVVFDNFPESGGEGSGFDALVRANVGRLIAGGE